VRYHYGVLGGSSGSAIEGSGVPASEVREVAEFDRIELVGSNNVVIRVGDQQSVVVNTDDNLLDHITTEVRLGELVVGNRPGSFATRAPTSVEITVPRLTALTLSGSGSMTVDGLAAQSFAVALPGSGTVSGSGTANRLDVSVAGSGVVQFTEVRAADVGAVVSGSGSISVTATERLDAVVSGSGAVLYAGSPEQVTKNITGTGAISGG
jgi:putative autotransporter adhesin-like protein